MNIASHYSKNFRAWVVKYYLDLKDEKTIRIANIISHTFGLLAIPYIILFFSVGFYLGAALLGLYLMGMLSIPYLNLKGFIRTSNLLLVSLTGLIIVFFRMMLGLEAHVHWILMALVVTPNLIYAPTDKKTLFSLYIATVFPFIGIIFCEYYTGERIFTLSPLVLGIVRYNNIFTLFAALVLQLFYLRYSLGIKEKMLKKTLFQNLYYRKALDQAAIVAVTDKSGTITEVNDNFCTISGYERNELIGQNHRLLNSGHHDKKFFVNVWKTISSGQPWRGEICNKAKNGQTLYWVDSVIVPCFDENNEIEKYFSIRFDITQKKISEEKLVHSAKMSSLGEMAAGVAHEINTPLAINKLLVENALNKLEMNTIGAEGLTEILKKMDKAISRIAKIVHGLKCFSREAEGDPMQAEDLAQIIDETLSLCQQRFIQNSVQLQVTPLKEAVFIDCRKVDISQVVLNFLTNSYDAVVDLAEKWVRIDVEVYSETVKLIITDSGSGIKPEVASKIFQPFFSTKSVGKGTGLGLSISIATIKSHHGTIQLDPSCANTRFIIELPKKSDNL